MHPCNLSRNIIQSLHKTYRAGMQQSFSPRPEGAGWVCAEKLRAWCTLRGGVSAGAACLLLDLQKSALSLPAGIFFPFLTRLHPSAIA